MQTLVETSVRGMSDLTAVEAALYGGLGGGLIGGVFALLGVVVERLLRQTGRLRFECSEPKLRAEVGPGLLKEWTEVDEGMSVQGAHYILPVDLFNGKEVPTGLRDVRVDLIRDDGERVESRPHEPLEGTAPRAVNVINIPPRQFVHRELQGGMAGEAGEAIKLKKWRKLEFVGELPKRPFFGILGSKVYRKTIIRP
jgi:hypothetical protein